VTTQLQLINIIIIIIIIIIIPPMLQTDSFISHRRHIISATDSRQSQHAPVLPTGTHCTVILIVTA